MTSIRKYYASTNSDKRLDTSMDITSLSNIKKKYYFLHIDHELDSNESWGHDIDGKRDTSIRIYFQNINGLKPHTNWHKWCDTLSALNHNHVDIVGLAEKNVN